MKIRGLDYEVWMFGLTKILGLAGTLYYVYAGNVPMIALSLAVVSLVDTLEIRYQLKEGELP